MNVQGLEWWGWLLIGLVMIGAEMLTPGMFLLFLGVAAILVGVLSGMGLLPAMWAQLLVFAALSIVSLVLFRRPLMARLNLAGRGPDDRDSLIGEMAVALEEVQPDAIGKVELRGSTWNAHNAGSTAIALGARCRVEAMEGLMLVLRPSPVDSGSRATAPASPEAN